jgi:cell division protein FtsB
MKNNYRLLIWLMLLLLMAVVCVGIKVRFVTDKNGRLAELEAQNKMQDRQIMELQKEIRILKTDVHILQYGFEGEENE